MKETIEEVSERYANTHQDVSATLGKYLVKSVFQDGAQWQAAKMYSEEEVLNVLFRFTNKFDLQKNIEITAEMQKEWFEQFKKK